MTGTTPLGREERRQRAVEGLLIADAALQDRLDRLARLTRLSLDAHWAGITVLDEDSAWFPAAVGFEKQPLPRRQTFCHTTTALDEVVVVPDARADARFADLDLVRSGAVTFYAGHPLRDPQGNVVGVLCVFDTRVRDLDEDQRRALVDLAALAEEELTSADDMAAAERVQSSMLPSTALDAEGWDVSGICLPALSVGGDFFDYAASSGVIDLVLGDVMGKGTGAALVGAGVRAALRGTHSAVTAGVDLGVTSTQVAKALLPDLERTGAFVTLLHVAIDADDGWTRYVDAGLGLALVRRADGSVQALLSEDLPFGVIVDAHWTEHRLSLGPGDRLVIFSDGLLDLLPPDADWTAEVGAMTAAASDVRDLLRMVTDLARGRGALDDVTVVAAFRALQEQDDPADPAGQDA